MCFVINTRAKRPTQRAMWKVVSIRGDGSVRSLIRSKHRWAADTSFKRDPGRTEVDSYDWWTDKPIKKAKHGIYVYTDKREALAACGSTFGPAEYVPMKVIVKPKDWLHSSKLEDCKYGRMATYDEVYVPEDQPYMEWY